MDIARGIGNKPIISLILIFPIIAIFVLSLIYFVGYFNPVNTRGAYRDTWNHKENLSSFSFIILKINKIDSWASWKKLIKNIIKLKDILMVLNIALKWN